MRGWTEKQRIGVADELGMEDKVCVSIKGSKVGLASPRVSGQKGRGGSGGRGLGEKLSMVGGKHRIGWWQRRTQAEAPRTQMPVFVVLLLIQSCM